MMKKVKDFQKKKEVEKIKQEKQEDKFQGNNLFNEFENNDFERIYKSLNFSRFSKKNKEKKKKKTAKTLPNVEVSIDLPNNLQNHTSKNKEPLYGCLKNGNKPTFNQYNKTQKYLQEEQTRIKIVLEIIHTMMIQNHHMLLVIILI